MARIYRTETYRDIAINRIAGGWQINAPDMEAHEVVFDGGDEALDDAKQHIDHELDARAEDDTEVDEDTTDPTLPMGEDGNECVDPLEDDEDDRPGSVVAGTFKAKYRERALTMARKPKDVPMKALKRSTNDWLAIELARRTLDEKAVLSVSAFEAILDANGVKHSHWNRTTKGWQGRLRMTGRLALQRVVAENTELALPDGTAIPAPKNWIAKHTH